MPLHDFVCDTCKNLEERFVRYDDIRNQTCKCGSKMKHVFLAPSKVFIFKEGFYEHIDKDPIYITSKKQLKAECAERGLTSLYATD